MHNALDYATYLPRPTSDLLLAQARVDAINEAIERLALEKASVISLAQDVIVKGWSDGDIRTARAIARRVRVGAPPVKP